MTKLRQAQLKSGDVGMTCWVNDVKGLKKGAVITLKTYIEPEREWEVEKLYDVIHDETDFVRNFDNNDYTKHFGLWDNVTK